MRGRVEFGVANVMGTNSVWELSDTLTVGRVGQGSLNVSGGGLVQVNSDMILGETNETESGAASVTISGSDGTTSSMLNVANGLTVGKDRAATLTMSDGAVVNSETSGGVAIIGTQAQRMEPRLSLKMRPGILKVPEYKSEETAALLRNRRL